MFCHTFYCCISSKFGIFSPMWQPSQGGIFSFDIYRWSGMHWTLSDNKVIPWFHSFQSSIAVNYSVYLLLKHAYLNSTSVVLSARSDPFIYAVCVWLSAPSVNYTLCFKCFLFLNEPHFLEHARRKQNNFHGAWHKVKCSETRFFLHSLKRGEESLWPRDRYPFKWGGLTDGQTVIQVQS